MTSLLSAKQLWILAVPFAAGVGASYSFGYWGYFHVDPLQFVGLSDLPKLAVYPLLVIVFTTALSAIFLQVTLAPMFPPGAGRDTPAGRVGMKYWRALVAAIILLLVAAIWWLTEPWNWFVACMLAPLLSVLLTHIPFFVALLPNLGLRQVVLLHLVLLPCLAFTSGRVNAISASVGKPYFFVDVARSGSALKSSFAEPIVFLGRLGETYIYLEQKSGSIGFIKAKDDAQLILKRSTNP